MFIYFQYFYVDFECEFISLYRVIMRREQVLKICLNHALTSDIIYSPKDERTWLFAANDFSEGELSLQQFCVRFKNKEVALEFKDAVDKARGGKLPLEDKKSGESDKNVTSESDDVVFVNEIQATVEEKEKAKELMLPENFFTYKNKDPCSGCRGCSEEDDQKTNLSSIVDVTPTKESMTSSVSTPNKLSTFACHSPGTSIYGTPTNFDRTFDNSLFRTPLESIGSNKNSATPAVTNKAAIESDVTNKENAPTLKPAVFSGTHEQKSLFGMPQAKTSNIFTGDSQTPTTIKSTVLAAPKLNPLNTSSDEKQNMGPKSVFGSAQANSLFGTNNNSTSVFGSGNTGTSINKSIFASSNDNSKGESGKPEVRSVFGNNEQNTNIFSNSSESSLFGPGALTSSKPQTGTTQSTLFGSAKFRMGGHSTAPWTMGSNLEQKADETISNGASEGLKKDKDGDDTKQVAFKVDNELSFATLSSSGPGFQSKYFITFN